MYPLSEKTIVPHRAIPTWIGACVVGVFLGILVLFISSLSNQYLYLGILVLLFPFCLMIIGNVKPLLLAVILIEISFQLDVNLNYDEAAASMGSIGGLNVSVTTILLLILYSIWFMEFLNRPPELFHNPIFRMSTPVIFYFSVVVFSAIVAPNRSLALNEIFLLFQTLLLVFYILHYVQSEKDVLFVLTLLLLGLLLQDLVIIALRTVGESFQIGHIKARIDHGFRVGGTVGSPNGAGAFVGMLLLPAFGMLLSDISKKHKIIAFVTFCLGIIALFFTLSRGAWLGFSVGFFLFCLFTFVRGHLPLALIVCFALLAIIFLAVYMEPILERLTADDRGAAYARIPLMKMTLNMIKDHPFLGLGANNYAQFITKYSSSEFRGEWLYTVHSKYFLVWAENGTLGLIAFLTFLFDTIRKGWKTWMFNNKFLSLSALALTLGILGHMIHMNFDLFNARPQVQLLWILAALINATYYVSLKKKAGLCP